MTFLQRLRTRFLSGKNPKFTYYISAYLKNYMPRWLLHPKVERLDSILERHADRDAIVDRVDYYCRAEQFSDVGHDAWLAGSVTIASQPMTSQKVYWLDAMEYARRFPSSLRWHLEPGDVNYVLPVPGICKSRPLCEGNEHSVLLNLDKVRHFCFLNDSKPWRSKKDMVVFRGKIGGKESRWEFMRRWASHARVDAGAIDHVCDEWQRPKMSLYAHLDYRYIMAIEGNDVASNLKWVMSSNSIAVMPRPTCESWFMEGRLIPGYHYIEVRPDFSDLMERLDYYSSHPDEAEAIVKHAHEFVAQFADARREKIVSMLVLRKYFRAVAQL